jgi:CheY-like chemotaxis protein
MPLMGAPAKSAAVLVVDDNDQARCSLAKLLELCGFATATAANGQLALDYLQDHPPPKLIVLDLMMPGMDGFAFRRAQKRDAALAAIPVLVLSAVADFHLRALRADGCAVEVKPMDPQRLIDRLRRCA